MTRLPFYAAVRLCHDERSEASAFVVPAIRRTMGPAKHAVACSAPPKNCTQPCKSAPSGGRFST